MLALIHVFKLISGVEEKCGVLSLRFKMFRNCFRGFLYLTYVCSLDKTPSLLWTQTVFEKWLHSSEFYAKHLNLRERVCHCCAAQERLQ